ncbi:gliding motility-associated C-terminal domain-containing protein, partial [Sphingobacterium alkalisoli]
NVAVAKGKDPKDRDVEGSSTDNNPLDPTDPDNPPVDPTCPECTIVEIDQEGAIEVIKTADLSQRFRYAGEQIAYEILIKNVGNVTLHDIMVTDANADDVNVGNIANLAVGESVTLQAYHTITQADMERGYVSNVAIASGKDPKDRDVIDESVSGNVPEAGDPIDPDCTNCTIAPLPWKVIEANNDTPAPVNGKDGSTTPSVLDNDMLNGSPVIPAEVTLTPGTSPHTGIVMNPDGTVTVSAETPAGTYTYPYTICEELNPSNCDNAVVTIVVEAALIEANNDTPAPINGKDGGTTPSVLDNDMLNGSPVIPSEVTLTPGTSPHTGITMNPDGTVTVSAETPAGTYTYPYTICEVLNPSNCDNAVMTIVVEAAVIEANDDTPAPINGKDGGTTPSVLDNDMLNGSPVIPSEVTLTWSPDNVESPAIILNTDGTVTVLPETPEGIYEFSYRICEVLNPTNCDEAAITIVIEPAPIVAMDDNIQIEWDRTSIITMSVLDNDAFNGGSIDLNEVTLTPGVPSDPNLSMNADGTINIPASTRPGTYTYPYTICEVLNPSNCSTAVATIVIEASNLFIPNVITPNGDGQNDRFEIIGSENYDRVEVTIVNRWGNEIFRNDNYDNNWTGRGLNEGTYYYIIKLYKGSKVEQHKGWVLIKTH